MASSSARRLSASILLSLTQKALKKVENSMRLALESRGSERRIRTTEVRLPKRRCLSSPHPKSAPALENRPRFSRNYTVKELSGLHIGSDVDVSRPSSAVFTNLKPVDGLVRPHSMADFRGLVRAEKPSVMDRLNLKLLERHPQNVIKNKQASRREKSPLTSQEVESMVSGLKEIVKQSRIAQARKNRDEASNNTQQMLTEFSGFGSKIRRQRNARRVASGDSSCKELVGLIELVDARLSTSESLSLLKEIGIQYEPRTAAGRKNAMATGFSAALGGNGLKIATVGEPNQEEPEDQSY